MDNIRRIIYLIGGLLSGGILMFAGNQMVGIRSVASASGSATVAELYYNTMGIGFIGLGIFALVLCVGLALRD